MKKTALFLVIALYICGCKDEGDNQEGPIVEGDVHLKTQEEVNYFINQGITHITRDVYIGEWFNPGVSNITNLDGLNTLTSIGG
ncbi:hypothetical protein, partial [Xanthovirga aplysinae]|uniref:hypothetical protein n=1 Tax=Xanthovirga aplysinae TaxID=2529853 RepID=UPI0012BC2387